MTSDGCLLLSGTITCPPWNTAWVNPAALVDAGYPEFANVTDLASFDAAAVSYLGDVDECESASNISLPSRPVVYPSDPLRFFATDRAEKFGNDQLGCTNSSGVCVVADLSANNVLTASDAPGRDQIFEDGAVLHMD